MSNQEPYYKVFNNRDQPVELHYGEQVVVVPSRGWVLLDEAALSSPQVQALRDRGFITCQEMQSDSPDRLQGEKAVTETVEEFPETQSESSPDRPAPKSEKATIPENKP